MGGVRAYQRLRPPKDQAMSTLIVFYSRGGHTRQIATELAAQCGADLEEIREARSRDGFWGYCRSALQLLTGALPPILKPSRDPANYDVVIIGTPVWVQRPAPPVRAYLQQNATSLGQVAYFCTLGGSGHRQTFGEMSRQCGKAPRATLAVTEAQLPAALHAAQVSDFLARVNQPARP